MYKDMKKQLLEMLRDDMMSEHKAEMRKGLDSMYEKGEESDMHEKMEDMEEKPKMKATIMADSKEGLIEGAKKLPEAVKTAEDYMKMRFGKDKKKS